MHADTAGCAQLGVERLADQRVVELVGARLVPAFPQDLPIERLVEEIEHGIFVGAEHPAHDLEREPARHRGADREHLVALVAEAREAAPDHFAHALGQLFGDAFRAARPVPVDAFERTALREVAQDLGDEERVALGLAVHRLREDRRRLLLADGFDERLHLVAVEPAQQHALVEVLSPQRGDHVGERMGAVELDVAIRAHDQDALATQVARQVLQQQERRLVGPVEVVEHEHDRTARPPRWRGTPRRPRRAASVRRRRRARATPADRGIGRAGRRRSSRPPGRPCSARRATRRRPCRARRCARLRRTAGTARRARPRSSGPSTPARRVPRCTRRAPR